MFLARNKDVVALTLYHPKYTIQFKWKLLLFNTFHKGTGRSGALVVRSFVADTFGLTTAFSMFCLYPYLYICTPKPNRYEERLWETISSIVNRTAPGFWNWLSSFRVHVLTRLFNSNIRRYLVNDTMFCLVVGCRSPLVQSVWRRRCLTVNARDIFLQTGTGDGTLRCVNIPVDHGRH